jgi:hypothetical protein
MVESLGRAIKNAPKLKAVLMTIGYSGNAQLMTVPRSGINAPAMDRLISEFRLL